MEDRITITIKAWEMNVGKTVPLVHYGPDGERTVIGEAKIEQDGSVTAHIFDPSKE